MGKHFRLTITRVFRSRRSKHSPPPPTTTTKESAIQIPPPTKHRRSSSFKRHVYSAFLCRCANKSDDDDDNITKPLDFHWRISEHEWNDNAVAAVQQNDGESPRQKIYNSSVSGDSDDTDILAPTMLPPPPKKRRSRRKKTTSKHNRVSASSADSGLYFSSEEREREETETLVSSSSRSFSISTDSSTEFNPQLETIREKPTNTTRRYKKRTKRKTTTSSRRSVTSSSAPESESPARLSVFKKLIPCAVEGKVKESFAVVKKSVDPYDDFYKSMSDMIYEKEMFDEKELEQLLQCFLSLNSPQYHGVIVQAFAAIWNSMFSSVNAASSTPTITS